MSRTRSHFEYKSLAFLDSSNHFHNGYDTYLAVFLTCRDGAGKCGPLICAHNAIEKLKAEQEVDLYSTVVMARLRRPQLVDKLVRLMNLI